jgi:hypothetical protein
MTVEFNWDIPDDLTIGEPVPRLSFAATAQVPSSVTDAARTLLGATSVQSQSDASVDVATSGGNTSVPVTLTSPETDIPASGPMTDTAVGTATFPLAALSRPGNAQVTVGTFVMHMTPRDAGGGLTYLGTITSTCTLDSGQDNLVTSVLINAAQPAAEPAVHSATMTPRPTPTKPKPPSLSPSPTRSVAITAAPTVTTHAPVAGPGGADIVIVGASALTVAGACGGLWWLLVRHR